MSLNFDDNALMESVAEPESSLPASQSTIPRVRPVMQALLAAKEKSSEKRSKARDIVLTWANQRWPSLLSEGALRGEDFEYDQPGLKLTSLALAEDELWCFRVEHQDSDPSQSRNWVIEAIVTPLDTGDVLGVKTQCSTTSARDVPATSPRFLRNYLDLYQLYDGAWPLFPRVISARTGIATSRLVELLQSPERTLPVVVFAEQAPDQGAQAERLIRRICGLAHVVVLPAGNAEYLNELIGDDAAITPGGIRTYLPGFGMLNDAQTHPLMERNRINSWRAEQGVGPGAFDDFLVAQIHRYSVASPEKLEQMPSAASIRQLKAERERRIQVEELALLRSQSGRSAEMATKELQLTLEERSIELQILQEELQKKNRQQTEWMEVAQDRDDAVQAMQHTVETLKAQNSHLHAALQRYRTGGNFEVPIPKVLDEIPEWVDEYYANRLVLLARAKRAIKGAAYLDVPLVYRSLQLLAVEYWSLRTATTPSEFAAAQLAFQSKTQALVVDEAPSISESRLGEFEEAYTVKYACAGRTKQVLARHIRGGSTTKDDRYCLRIYFFWDDEEQKTVIGHLPSHLDTRAT